MKTVTHYVGRLQCICLLIFTLGLGLQSNDLFAANAAVPDQDPVEVVNLNLTSECSFYEDELRWRVTNPNDFSINVNWLIVGTSIGGSYKAPSGLSYFFTQRFDGPNTTKLFWQDENDNEKQKTQAANNSTCDVCEKENVVQDDLYQLSDAADHSIVLPGLLCENKRARFTFDDTNLGYIYVVDNDGDNRDGWLHILGQAQITENAVGCGKDYSEVLWDVDVWFRPASDGEAEPKFELDGQDDSDWRYWILMSGGMFNKANPDEQISFLKMENDFGLQVGNTANGKNLNYGASTWFNLLLN